MAQLVAASNRNCISLSCDKFTGNKVLSVVEFTEPKLMCCTSVNKIPCFPMFGRRHWNPIIVIATFFIKAGPDLLP